jgi:hypothetical protein
MQVEAEFEERWNAGTVQGWEDKGVGTEQTSSRGQPLIDIEDYDSVEELLELGPDRLKEVNLALSWVPELIVVTRDSLQRVENLLVNIRFKIQLSDHS